MNGYLFTAGVRQTRLVPDRGMRTWDSSVTAIVYGQDAEQTQRAFESWLCSEEAEQGQVQIKRIVAAQLVDQLLTESGAKPIDWADLVKRSSDPEAAMAVETSEQGLWVDVNQLATIGGFTGDVESVCNDAPEEIASSLNWSPSKLCLFLVIALSPPPPPPDPEAQFEEKETTKDVETEEMPAQADDLDEFVATLPDMREKRAAALVEARNALVAGCLWRKFCADTPVASNEIHVGQCCLIFAAE